MERILIAGSGPAGLTAAIYAARANLAPVVVEGTTPGGQLIVSADVENYPGFVGQTSGMEIMARFREQAEALGARFVSGNVNKVERTGRDFRVHTDDAAIETQTLIIATGAEARRLTCPGEQKLYGRGVSGCATCDGAFYRNKHVLVVGGGNTALDNALFLTKFAARVTIVHRRDYFRAAAVTVEKARKHPKIAWNIPATVGEILGDKEVTGARLKNPDTGAVSEIACDGIFVAIGHDPKTAVFKDIVAVDEHGFIVAREGSTETDTPGVFACGDVRDRVYKQAVVAAGHGCMAAMDVERYLGVRE